MYIFITCAFGVISKKPLPNPRSWRFMSMSSSNSFVVWVLTFRSEDHFVLIFVCGMKQGSSFILWHVDVPLSLHNYWKDCSFPIDVPWCPCLKSTKHKFGGLFFGFSVLLCWSACLFLCQYQSLDYCSSVLSLKSGR